MLHPPARIPAARTAVARSPVKPVALLLSVRLLRVARLLPVARLRVSLLAVALLPGGLPWLLLVGLRAMALLVVTRLPVRLLPVARLPGLGVLLLSGRGLSVSRLGIARLAGRLAVLRRAGLLGGRRRGRRVGALGRLLPGAGRVGERLGGLRGPGLARLILRPGSRRGRRGRLVALVPILVAAALGHGAHRTVAWVATGWSYRTERPGPIAARNCRTPVAPWRACWLTTTPATGPWKPGRAVRRLVRHRA